MINDLISDMLTRIRNASLAKHKYTTIIYTKIAIKILNVFISEGYIFDYKIYSCNKTNTPKFILIILKYKGWWIKTPVFSILKRISKPGKRIYSSYKYFQLKLNILKYHQGIAIISTSNGIMSHTKAVLLKKGGEILCYIE
jgi:small subunit ribosomal protein S8